MGWGGEALSEVMAGGPGVLICENDVIVDGVGDWGNTYVHTCGAAARRCRGIRGLVRADRGQRPHGSCSRLGMRRMLSVMCSRCVVLLLVLVRFAFDRLSCRVGRGVPLKVAGAVSRRGIVCNEMRMEMRGGTVVLL